MGGVLNVLLGALLAAGGWFGPRLYADELNAVSPLLVEYAHVGVVAGGVLAAVGVIELIFSVLGSIFKALFGRKEIVLTEGEVDDIFKRLTVAMASADGELSDSEVEIVVSQNLQRRNIHLTGPDVRELAADPKRLRQNILKDIRKNQRGLSWDAKRQIVETLEWILRSDFRIDDAELGFVKTVAEALDLDPERRAAIAKSVEDRHMTALKMAASAAAPEAPSTPAPTPAPTSAPTPAPTPAPGATPAAAPAPAPTPPPTAAPPPSPAAETTPASEPAADDKRDGGDTTA